METKQLSPEEHAKSLGTLQRLMLGACLIAPALYWLGVINTGPVEWLQSAGFLTRSVTDITTSGFAQLFESMNSMLLGLVGGLSWGMLSALCLMPFTRRIAVKFLGSEDALQMAQEVMHVAETTPDFLGELVAVTVNRGGFLSHDESSIETTQGFYRVLGRVGNVPKGAEVTVLDGSLRITSDNAVTKKYTLLK
tara:strand:- start:17826 stop:18407 length:582 start_codon:yes stop_codon:yes gene_type:complete